MSAAHVDSDHQLRSEQAASWAVRLADGELSLEQESAFASWLKADGRNREALEEILGVWVSAARYSASPQVLALREAALASARQTGGSSSAPPRGRRVAAWLTAAVLLVTLIGAGLWTRSPPTVYTTGVGERRVVVLHDGSRLSLDGATTVKVRFSNHRRWLSIEQGRAKFDVAKNPARPFVVSVGEQQVIATGTAFSIELVQQEIRVLLYEGSVEILDEGRPIQPASLDPSSVASTSDGGSLKAGWQIVLPYARAKSAGAPVPPPTMIADTVSSLSWQEGMLAVDDEPLPVVVERMNRHAVHPLEVGDSIAEKLTISGVFRVGDTEALVQGLEAFGIVARREGDTIRLYGSAEDGSPG